MNSIETKAKYKFDSKVDLRKSELAENFTGDAWNYDAREKIINKQARYRFLIDAATF